MGRGDSKLIMGLGAVIGLNFFNIFGPKNYWFFGIIGKHNIVGAIYGLL